MSAKPAASGAARRRPKRPTPKPKVARPKPSNEFVVPGDVVLAPAKGTTGRGGGEGGEAWRIEVHGQRAGIVFINLIDEPPVGEHASIQIYLNKPSQGRHIGRVAYRKACEASRYDVIYAHMRKSNHASRRAAEEAGFKEDARPGAVQLLLVWRRGL
ncbi:MAG: N-acetyltransferase [Hyphomicrobiales bacterium]|nr:MAG: N-acetyltransferase [Hyphomicrobiales bacterium]